MTDSEDTRDPTPQDDSIPARFMESLIAGRHDPMFSEAGSLESGERERPRIAFRRPWTHRRRVQVG
jgi:hypothetical protein